MPYRLCRLGAFVVLLPWALSAQQAAPAEWKLKGGQLKLSSDAIVYERKSTPPISAPTNSITSICYDTATPAPGPSAWQVTQALGSSSGQAIIFAPIVIL